MYYDSFPKVCKRCGEKLIKQRKFFCFDKENGNKIFKVKFVCPTKNFLGFSHNTYSSWWFGSGDGWNVNYMEDEKGNPVCGYVYEA